MEVDRMNQKKPFYKVVWSIVLPVTLQSLLQSSFGVVDQIMTGQLGSVSIAGIGLGTKFSSIFSVLVSAIAAAAGIMIAQYAGKKEEQGVSRSFWVNLVLALVLAAVFILACLVFPREIMALYTGDENTENTAAGYLRIVSFSFLPAAVTLLVSTLLRCMDEAVLPLYASIFGAVVNTGLNYVLIFGRWGFPELGVTGAALATVCSQSAGCILLLFLFLGRYRSRDWKLRPVFGFGTGGGAQYMGILLPILACEFFWSLGENVYAVIYGHIGTDSCAAMTLTTPVQVLFMGMLSGLAQAAGILTGKTLGREEYDRAFQESLKLMKYGLVASGVLSVLLILCSRYYVDMYGVSRQVKELAWQIMEAFALIAPVKVQNMILGGGILRSGGKTGYVMTVDFVGTWLFGVPLGVVAAFVWNLSIPWVYFILSLEEWVRFLISVLIFRKGKWMGSLPKIS